MMHVATARASEPKPLESRKPWVPDLEVDTYKLANGLTVILHEDHKTPLVAVNVIYNVGAKDDPPGRSGFAHLFEHLMFEGSEHNDGSYHWPIYRFMTDARGATSADRTAYHETVTSNALERVLWLEADRMGFFLPAVTSAKLCKARDVVKNERRQTLDDLALGEVDEAQKRALYPLGHPYRHSVVGSMDDLSAAHVADVSAFFQSYYAPNNAFLCLAGDFESRLARAWIARYFGSLPPRSLPPPQEPRVKTLDKPRRIVLHDQVSHAHAKLVWPTVPANHADEPALDVQASVLGGTSKWNRLFRALMYDHQAASLASAAHPTLRLSGTFEIDLAVRSGQNLEELVKLVDAEIERIKKDGPTADEVRRVKIERRRSQISELESVTSKARVLNFYAATLGDPLGYRTVLTKVFAVTPDDVKRAARAYLGAARLEILVYPGSRAAHNPESDCDLDESGHDGGVAAAPLVEAIDRSVVPEVGLSPEFVPPRVKRRRLSNRLELLIVERHDLPQVQLKLVVRSGETSVTRDKSGLATITVNMLEEGTRSRDALQLESDLSEIGASLWTEGLAESCTVNLTTVTRHLDRALDLLADAVLNPSFSDKEFLRLRLAWIEYLKSRADHADQIAEDIFPRLLYPREHPYSWAKAATVESVRLITRQDVVAFYDWAFVPANATLIVVGDVALDKITGALEARFGAWPARALPSAPDLRLMPSPAVGPTIYLIDKPGATQSVLYIGRIGTSVRSLDRHALVILKDQLGGRIGANLCDDKACTYGFAESFDFRKGAGPFFVKGAVHLFETRAALAEVFKEMSDLAGARPVTDEEIADIQEGKLPSWIDSFETNADVVRQLAYKVSHELPDHYFARELPAFFAVNKNHVDRVAKTYLAPRRMTILVVGDRSWIEESIKSLPFGKHLRLLDADGNPLAEPTTPTHLGSVAAQ
jgi:zinc protease